MQTKSVFIDYIHYINFILFNIGTLFNHIFSLFTLLKLTCVLYTRPSYMS